ncbi:MAG TPA: hypothetical protein VGL54_01810 [Solirubrobacteraceae bacterium]
MAKREDSAGDEHARHAGAGPSTEERARAEAQLARLLDGDGLSMVVQPIVDVRTGSVHAYEALARFAGSTDSPLHWLEIAAMLGVPLAQGYYTGRPGRPWPDVRVARHSARTESSAESSAQSSATLAPAEEQPPTDIPSADAVPGGSLLPV